MYNPCLAPLPFAKPSKKARFVSFLGPGLSNAGVFCLWTVSAWVHPLKTRLLWRFDINELELAFLKVQQARDRLGAAWNAKNGGAAKIDYANTQYQLRMQTLEQVGAEYYPSTRELAQPLHTMIKEAKAQAIYLVCHVLC